MRIQSNQVIKKGFAYLGFHPSLLASVYKCNHCGREYPLFTIDQKEILLDFGCNTCGNLELVYDD